jgi:hypothetical protein
MALNHLGIQMSYRRLRKILRAGEDFTPFTHLRYLEQVGLSVLRGEQGDVSLFERCIAIGLPVIVGVRTLYWQHWEDIVTQHAVVVVGVERAHGRMYINDPFFARAPIEMPLTEFEAGWIEGEGQYAVISLTPLEDSVG